MSFLNVNGVALGAVNLTESVREIGNTTAAFDGTLRKSRQATKRDLDGGVPPMTQADAYAWEQHLRGIGETWSFETSLYGSKGTGPAGDDGSPALSAVHAKFGSKSLVIPNDTADGLQFVITSDSGPYTVSLWHYYSGAWHHRIFGSAGGFGYVDGVQDSTAGNDGARGIDTSTGSGYRLLNLGDFATGTLGGAQYFDDLVILPYAVPVSWVAGIYAKTVAFSALPVLTVTGDAIPESTRSCMGEAASSEFMQAVVDGSFRTNARKLSFKLSQV